MQKITFATNTGKNTLEYVKLLLKSLRENLDSDEHQILVFIDADNENTLEYLLSIKDTFKDLTIINNNMGFPVGYQRNKTLITQYAKHDIVSYLQSDMVIGPHYDTEILQHVRKGRILSATRVEPPLHGTSPVTFTKNFGLHPDGFNFDAWNEYSSTIKRDEIIPYFFAPITYYKEDWMLLDGYDTAFRRSREDSELVQRCVHAGIELMQTFSANVYHFTCVSSRGENWFDPNNIVAKQRAELQSKADQIELRRFIRKWGNFSHDYHKLQKLDIDLVATNLTITSGVDWLEPFFSRVWVPTQELADNLITILSNDHRFANQLLDVSDEQWNKYKHLFNLTDFSSIIKVGTPESYAVKVTIDMATVTPQNQFMGSLQYLYELLKDCEPGEYEIDGVHIVVNKIVPLVPQISANNPPFDHTLLTVY